jgi:hypothetical protein
MKKMKAVLTGRRGKADRSEPGDEPTSSMRHLSSGESREGYCGEDRNGCLIEGDALHSDRWIPTFGPPQRLQVVTEVMTAIYAGAEVVQVGIELYWVTAPLEVIPRLVKARECTLPPTCKAEFFEQAHHRRFSP